jgi:hypothetical protein
MQLPSMDEVDRLLAHLRGQVDPMLARRFACACVRRIWAQVESQRYVPPDAMEHCREAVTLTEQSLVGQVDERDLQAIDFGGITDNGDEAFMAAAHVGWNLFAPVNQMPQVNEFDNAREIAFLAACVGGPEELSRQIQALQDLVCEELNSPTGE